MIHRIHPTNIYIYSVKCILYSKNNMHDKMWWIRYYTSTTPVLHQYYHKHQYTCSGQGTYSPASYCNYSDPFVLIFIDIGSFYDLVIILKFHVGKCLFL